VRLRILLPSHIFLDREVVSVSAEAANGAFMLLPRHIDFAMALVPGILSFRAQEGSRTLEEFMAVDEGILVKTGAEVRVSTRRAVRGPDLGRLRHLIEDEFLQISEQEKHTRSALAGLETDLVRRFIELRER
jgi:F-type H+-transporting ATPase subunit epsilon